MCKIMVLKGIENSAMALDFMKAVAPSMSFGNNDGIGYSAINSSNKLFSEKWHVNNQFLQTDVVIDAETLEKLEPFRKRLPNVSLNYQKYGDVTREDLRTVTLHTRFATCGKEFANTHPFIDHEMSLIHNGGISNCNTLALNRVSTCDSENALQLYNNKQLNLQTTADKFQQFTDELKGYWAFAFLAKDGNGDYMLDIVRERASLHFSYIPEMGADCIVFATTAEIIEKGIKELGLPERKKIFNLTEFNYNRFNAVTGELLLSHQLTESALNGYSYDYRNYNKFYNKKNNVTTYYPKEKTLVEVKTPTVDEIYEGYMTDKTAKIAERKFKEAMLGIVDDDLAIESFYDIEQLLIDRLYDYDKLMNTSYGDSFEDLPVKVRLFIERKEEEDYIIFDDVLIMIETYIDTGSISGIYKVYKTNKRA
jgi:hypothetical protein